MKLFKKIFSIILAGAFVLGTSVFSTSTSDKKKYEVENTSLISNEMGGGGTPSIDEPDDEKPKVFPQPEVQDVIIPDDQKVNWSDELNNYIAQKTYELNTQAFTDNVLPIVVNSNDAEYRGSELPAGYTQIEYLESTGTQWIDTGYVANIGSRLELEFKFNNLIKEQLNGVHWNNNSGFAIGVVPNLSSSKFTALFGHSSVYLGTLDNLKHNASIEIISSVKGIFKLDGDSVEQTMSYNSDGRSVYLFGRHNTNTDDYCLEEIYSCQIYDNETLVRDYIPCYDSNKVLGLYDVVNGVFYTNQGSGAFNGLQPYTYSLQGNGTEEDPYQISSAMDLAYWRYAAANNRDVYRKNKFYVLTQDIYLNDGYFEEDGTYHDGKDGKLYYWDQRIDTYSSSINGQGYTIYGLYGNTSLFSVGVNATHKDIKVKNFYTTGTSVVFSQNAGNATYHNIVCEGIANVQGHNFGVIMDYGGGRFYNCISKVKLIGIGRYVGGILREASGTTILQDCVNYTSIYSDSSNTLSKGGIVAMGANNAKVKITGCKNYGDVEGTQYVYQGGIVGSGATSAIYEISDCENYGKCRNSMIGNLRPGSSLKFCKNYGNTSWGGFCDGVASDAVIVGCENHAQKFSGAAFAYRPGGKIYRCRNYASGGKGLFVNSGGIYEECESYGNTTYILGETFNTACKVKNCIIRGNISNAKGIANTNNGKIEGLLFEGSIAGVPKKQYYGSDFSAFFVKWKTGYIGLKALESAGVYMFAIPSEEYLQSRGFVNVG